MRENLLFKLSFLFCLLMVHAVSLGQQAVLSAGGVATGSKGSVSYSIGQVFFKSCNGAGGSVGGFRDTLNNTLDKGTLNEDNFSVSEGVQQTYGIEVLVEIEDFADIELTYSVFPNPAADFLILKTDNLSGRNLSCLLFDISGRLLVNQQIENTETTISLIGGAESLYILKVIDSLNQKEVKVFKIIKN